MTDDRKTIRIFIGSPGDVEAERAIAYRVITEVEGIFQSFKDYVPGLPIPLLRAVGWEQVPPEAGLPNNLILERFPIEDSHIFVFILWKRFGSAPGTRRPTGAKYGSGTQEEFERAYREYSNNKTGFPFIMVYQKKDDFSLQSLPPKEIDQFKKVAKFIENCQSSGGHPALTRQFLAKDFEGLFRKNLLDIILKLSFPRSRSNESSAANKISPPQISAGQAPDTDDHPGMRKWLMDKNLSANPFRHYSAEDEKDLEKYYVPFKGYPLIASDILQGKKNWLFFGKEGSGKTALKKLILSRCAPSRETSETLALEYETADLREVLKKSDDPDEILLGMARQLKELASKAAGRQLGGRDFSEPVSIFRDLGKSLHDKKKFDRTLFLLDIAQPGSVEYTQKHIGVLANLAALPADRVGFRLFLPNELQTAFLHQEEYLGKCDWREIKWEDKDLKELIRRRLNYYSINRANPCQALAVLCEPRGKMRSIDDEIIALSDQRPRAVIWLANRLLLEHCQNDPIPAQITQESWDKTLSEWWTNGQKMILGASGKKETFSMNGTDPYFGGQPLKLSKRSKMLIKTLIEADSRICSKDELIRAAWIGSKSDGVSEKAVRQAVQRLRDELKEKNQIDPTWIKSIYDQGYQLIEPEFVTKPGNTTSIGGDVTHSTFIIGNNNTVIAPPKRKRSIKEDK